MRKLSSILLYISCTVICGIHATKTLNTHITPADLERFQKVFTEGINSNDLQSIYYGSLNIRQISNEIKDKICQRIYNLYMESKLNEFEKNYYLIGTHKKLNCPSTHLPANIVNTIKSSLAKEFTTAQEMFFVHSANKYIDGVTIDDATKLKLAKNLQTILKKDDSLNSLGYAFYTAAEFGTHGSLINDWIEGAFAQADEVDGKFLQFEGGLSITSLIFNGAMKLTNSINKSGPLPITEEQLMKFTSYFLSRRSAQLVKGVHLLLESLSIIVNDNRKMAPICIQIIGNGQYEYELPIVNVKIVDVLGNQIVPAIKSVSATVKSISDNQQLLAKTPLESKSSDRTVFALDLTKSQPTRGNYDLEIFVNDNQWQQNLLIKILGKVEVKLLEIGIGDSDSQSSVRRQTIEYPKKITEILNADAQQKIVLKTILIDKQNLKPITVHQAFIRLENLKTHEEIIFVAEQDSAKAYKFDMDVGARSSDFGHKSGLYSFELIVGDVSVSNSFKWEIASIELKFSQEPKKVVDTSNLRAPRPEIVHQFREPEKRPPVFVSNLFTGLCAIPLLILFILWGKIGVNVSNFQFSLSAFGFHLGFGGILVLFGIFWLKLNMFETIRYLLPLAFLTFLCGNRLLRSVACRKPTDQHK